MSSRSAGRTRRKGIHDTLIINLGKKIVIPGSHGHELGEYFSIRVTAIRDKQGAVPSVLHHLVSKQYHIGPNGCTIGTGARCHIRLPEQAEVDALHAEITWEQNRFMLHDPADKMAVNNQHTFPAAMQHEMEFVTGRIVWLVIALPPDIVFNLKLFTTARNGDLERLKVLIVDQKKKKRNSSQERRFSVVEYLQVAVREQKQFPVQTEKISINVVDDTECSTTDGGSPRAKMLLHIAIEIRHHDMISYLLENGADVNKCVGEGDINSMHIAARCNDAVAMALLLGAGGDVESQDANGNTPLSWTTDYQTQCILLHTQLLCCAARHGNLAEVQRLLSTTKASPNGLGLRHKNALHLSSHAGHVDIVSLLLEHKASVNSVGGSQSRTAMHYASVADNVEVARVLQDAGADCSIRDVKGYTAINLSMGGNMCQLLHQGPMGLCLAVQGGDLEKVKEQLMEGAGARLIDQRNEQGHAPLHIACTLGYIDHVRLLVEQGADINLRGGSNQWSPLYYAAVAGQISLVEFLLDIGANSQLKDCKSYTVRQVVEQAQDEVAKQLTQMDRHVKSDAGLMILPAFSVPTLVVSERGVDQWDQKELLLRDQQARLQGVLRLLHTPAEKIVHSLDNKNITEFRALLKSDMEMCNVVVDTGDRDSMSILCMACEMGTYMFVEELLIHGVKPSIDNLVDNCPLHVACGNGHTDIVQLLITYPPTDINQQATDTLSTPLHVAAYENFIELVELLLEHGADPDIRNGSGEKPYDCTRLDDIRKLLATGANKLLYSAGSGDPRQVTKLVNECSIPIDAESHHGNTALHEASRCGHDSVVKVLVELGASVDRRSGQSGFTSLHYASVGNHLKVINLLLEKGARRDVKDCEGKVPFEVAISNEARKLLMKPLKEVPVVSHDPTAKTKLCFVCEDQPVNTILMPCGHQALCSVCVEKIRCNYGNRCPLDQQTIVDVMKVFNVS